MKRFILGLLLALALPAAAQTSFTCVKDDTRMGFTLSCALPHTVTPPPPPPTDPCSGITDARFLQALSEQLDPWGFFWRMGRSLTAEELACVRARKIPGFEVPAPTGNSSDPTIPREGFVLGGKGNPLRNLLRGGQTYNFVLNSPAGERVQFNHAEMPGTPDSMTLITTIFGPNGEVLYGPEKLSSRFASTTVVSPGGVLTYRLVPSEDGWLVVLRY